MSQEIKICQNCNSSFVIEDEDFLFYEKIHVPQPTWCPECRMKRRFIWFNDHVLYKRKCDAPGHTEELITVYAPESPYTVYDQEFWWSDLWDPVGYGRDYDFSRPFFEQFRELLLRVPQFAAFNSNSINCFYCVNATNAKNCYLSIIYSGENSGYVYAADVKDSFDVYLGISIELCYECLNTRKGFKALFSFYDTDMMDSFFTYDCRNIKNCFGCVGLRNKQYCIWNEQYSPEEYRKKIQTYDLGSFQMLEKLKHEFHNFCLGRPHRFAKIIHSTGVSGDSIHDTRNCYFCFNTAGGVENSKYVVTAGENLKDGYDCYNIGKNAEFLYEVGAGGINGNRIFFSLKIRNSNDIQYSKDCFNCYHLFGCIGLRNKSYCIFNKQYTKEEYEKLIPCIIEHMDLMPYRDKNGLEYRYGEFFPSEFSPFSYNESLAQEFFPLTKNKVKNLGYRWKDAELKSYSITIQVDDLPDHIKDVSDTILEETIECAHKGDCNEQCVVGFKLIPMELEFYRKMNLSLPRLCPNCRHFQRIQYRNPLKLWHRKCTCAGKQSENTLYTNQSEHFHKLDHCPNEFETSYAPERPEIVYCEQCYQNETL